MRHIILALALLLPTALHAQAVTTNTTAAPMAADADPSFDVATIKPHPLDAPYAGFRLVNIQGEHYSARNVSLVDLTKFAYSMQLNQVIGLPAWANEKHFDISATMQPVGHPNGDQLRTMLRKLLADRFKLASHIEQRVLPVYTLTVAKPGLKAPVSDGKLNGDFENEAPGGMKFGEHNATSKMWANYLQQALMNRPVVDQTALPDRYDFAVTFMPDDTMFGGRFHFPDSGENAAPNIYTALQEQLGLKLTPEKTSVDVLVIDHAEEPSGN
jgi:uncharacterized protein (TIGR03435 family)